MPKELLQWSSSQQLNQYAALLTKCGITKNLAECKRLHSEIRGIAGCNENTFLNNLLVQAFGKCGNLVDAKAVFDATPSRNLFSWNIGVAAFAQNERLQEAFWLFDRMPATSVVSWTTMLSAYAQKGHLQEARLLFERMPERNTVTWNSMILAYSQAAGPEDARLVFEKMPQRNSASWNSMLTAYACTGHLDEAVSVLQKMPQWDSLSWNPIVSGFGEAGNLEDADRFFMLMPERNVVSWTAMITAQAQCGYPGKSIQLFRKMDLEGVQANQVTMVATLDACAKLGASQVCRVIHSSVLKSELLQPGEAALLTALLNMYCKCGMIDEAKRIYDASPSPDAASSTVMIAAYAQIGKLTQAKATFDGIRIKDLIAWNALVGAYACNGLVERGSKVYDRMPGRDVASWNTMLVGYIQVGHTTQALRAFCSMDLEGVVPDKITLLSVLDACAGLPDWTAVPGSILECSVADITVSNALIHMYGRRGDLERGKEVLDWLPYKDAMSWNIVISAYARNGHLREAMGFFRRMCLAGEVPNEITSITILSSCSHAGSLLEGVIHFVSLHHDFGVSPTLDHCLCLVDMLARSGHVEEAEQFVKGMEFGSYEDVAWKTLLSASGLAADVERGVSYAQRALGSRPDDPAPYVLLSNLYAEKFS